MYTRIRIEADSNREPLSSLTVIYLRKMVPSILIVMLSIDSRF